MIHTKLLTAVAAAAVLAAPAAFAQTADAAANAQAAVAPTSPVAASNVIDTLKERGQFVTLLAALDQAQLTDTLASRPRITLFAPTEQRTPGGHGFTHMVGDLVSIRSPKLGTLTNKLAHCDKIAPWTFGAGALMRNLAARGLLR